VLREFNLVKDEEIFPQMYKNEDFKFFNFKLFSKQHECDYDTDNEIIGKAKRVLV